MDERPRPDLDQTREALRQHDERAEEPALEEEGAPPAEEESTADDSDSGED